MNKTLENNRVINVGKQIRSFYHSQKPKFVKPGNVEKKIKKKAYEATVR